MMRIGSKPIEFELHVDENTPALVVGDVLRVKQILNNVLSNAFKYTEEGLVTLSLFHETWEADGCFGQEAPDVTLVFIVSDTGQGMTPDQVSKLFDEYTRFNQDANRTIEGVGLGMSITRNLVRLMNGDIFVESEFGRGTTVTVRLPQRKVGTGVLGREIVDQLRQFRTRGKAHMKRLQIIRDPMPYGTVLVVDDVATNLYVAKGLLASYDLTVDSAENGFEAIEKIKQGKVYDIVFMDHMMPGMDGIEATEVIRGLGYTRPVVALTANAMIGRSEMFLERGFDDFIAKPIDLRQMNAALNKYVRDVHPPEVVEAARRQKKSASAHDADAMPQASVDPHLVKTFLRDASKTLVLLERLCAQQDAYSDEDIRAYVINIHGMKSALATIGEPELSSFAFRLEQAGREGDSGAMSSDTPAFLKALRVVMEKNTPKGKDDGDHEVTDADRAYLREKLRVLQAACAVYDKKAARDVLSEIDQKAWPHPTKERLDAIATYLLHSKFKAIMSAVDDMMEA
jgi:CheY-like chemotaxis protein